MSGSTDYGGEAIAGAAFSDAGFNRLYDPIEAVLPGVAHAMVQVAVRDTIEEFCLRSLYWRNTVLWQMPVGASLANLDPVDDLARAGLVLSVTGLTRWQLKPPAILIDPGPATAVRSGQALVVCKPSWVSDYTYDLPSFLTDDWSEALRDGALSRLYSQPSKPYSSAQLAQYHGQRFRAQIRLAREMAGRFNDYGRWAFPYFGRGHQVTSAWGSPGAGDLVTPPPGPLPDVAIPLADGETTFDGGSYDADLSDNSNPPVIRDGGGY